MHKVKNIKTTDTDASTIIPMTVVSSSGAFSVGNSTMQKQKGLTIRSNYQQVSFPH